MDSTCSPYSLKANFSKGTGKVIPVEKKIYLRVGFIFTLWIIFSEYKKLSHYPLLGISYLFKSQHGLELHKLKIIRYLVCQDDLPIIVSSY